VTIA